MAGGNHVAMNQKQLLLQSLDAEKYGAFRAAFKLLNSSQQQQPSVAFDKENLKPSQIATNRYSNIPCLDYNRVILENGRYIHANYVNGANGNPKIIATQGPLKATVADFWAMINQVKAPMIVMLCKCVEEKIDERTKEVNEVEKCYGYWPTRLESPVTTKKLLIHAERIEEIIFVSGTKQEKVVKSAIKIVDKLTKEVIHRLVHLQYVDWPDLSVPENTTALMEICKRYVLPAMKTGGPIIAHCSAGVGRTGVFVGAVVCLDLFLHGQLISMSRAVALLRTQRAKSVQSPEQYAFLHILFLELLEYCSGEDLQELKGKYIKFLNKIKTTPRPKN